MFISLHENDPELLPSQCSFPRHISNQITEGPMKAKRGAVPLGSTSH